MQESILTPEQVSKILQVHPFTVLKFIKQGKLKASKLGRVYRIRESDLESFLDNTSGKTTKSSDSVDSSEPQIIRKSKNKNKINLNSDSSIPPADNLAPTTEHQTILKEIPVTEIKIDKPDQVKRNQHGGEDHYYILQ